MSWMQIVGLSLGLIVAVAGVVMWLSLVKFWSK
jgi:hypothetical protein